MEISGYFYSWGACWDWIEAGWIDDDWIETDQAGDCESGVGRVCSLLAAVGSGQAVDPPDTDKAFPDR